MINPFKKTFTNKEQALFSFLRGITLFKELDYKQMSVFLPYMHTRTYKKDEVLFFRDDPSRALYMVKSGRVALDIDINDSFENLTTVGAGVALGESCFLRDSKRLLNAFIISDIAEFYVIPQDNIFAIFEGNPKIKLIMLEALANLYNDYNSNLFKAYKSSGGFFNLSQVYKS